MAYQANQDFMAGGRVFIRGGTVDGLHPDRAKELLHRGVIRPMPAAAAIEAPKPRRQLRRQTLDQRAANRSDRKRRCSAASKC